jgi:hypothetical protein
MAVDLSVYQRPTLVDHLRQAAKDKFEQNLEARKLEALRMRAQRGDDLPAAIQIVNDLENSAKAMNDPNLAPELRARARERYISMHQVAKTFAIDRGMEPGVPGGGFAPNPGPPVLPAPSFVEGQAIPGQGSGMDATDPQEEFFAALAEVNQERGGLPPQSGYARQPRAIPGFADQAGGIKARIKGMETQAQKNVELDMEPLIAGAKKDAELASEAQGELNKKSVKANDMMAQIKSAREILPGATGSGLGTARDFGKRMVGMSDSKTQATAKLATISGWLVSNVPRMEGPQSDFDVENYKTMAAMVGNSSVPIEDRLAALDELENLMKKYAHLNAGKSRAQELYEAERDNFNANRNQPPVGGTGRVIDFNDLPD